MNVDEIFSVPDVSFRLAFPLKFNQKGAILCSEISMQYNELWEFLNDPQAIQPQILRTSRQTGVFPLQVKTFVQQISGKVENQVFTAIVEYEKTHNATTTLKSRQLNSNFPEKLKALPPRIHLGTTNDAQSISEWAQLEIDRVTEEANRKILEIAIRAHERLMQEIIRKQKIMMQELPDEAAQLWIELHTTPGATSSNSSDLEWCIKDCLTRKRTDEELRHVQDSLDRLLQRGEIDEETKLNEITKKTDEEIETEELIPLSAAAFRIALIIGIRGGKLKYQLEVISRQVVQAQKQKEQEARNEETCTAMNANPTQGEKAIGTIIRENVQQEVSSQLRKQGNGNAVDQRNQQATAIQGRFNKNKNKKGRPDFFHGNSKSKKRKQPAI
jgi:hypothetical protein